MTSKTAPILSFKLPLLIGDVAIQEPHPAALVVLEASLAHWGQAEGLPALVSYSPQDPMDFGPHVGKCSPVSVLLKRESKT